MGDQDPVAGPDPRARVTGSVLVELGFVAVALSLYLVVSEYTEGHTVEAAANARDLLALEVWLGMDWEHAVQDATLATPWLSVVATQFYVWGYLPVVLGTLAWLFVRHRDAYRPFRNALLVSGLVGLVVYAFYPCAPPWIGGEGFTDTVGASSVDPMARPALITNHLGALPSFHVGWLILVGWRVSHVASSRLVRTLCIAWPVMMSYAVVATGNHWVLDVPAGAALAAVGVLMAGPGRWDVRAVFSGDRPGRRGERPLPRPRLP